MNNKSIDELKTEGVRHGLLFIEHIKNVINSALLIDGEKGLRIIMSTNKALSKLIESNTDYLKIIVAELELEE